MIADRDRIERVVREVLSETGRGPGGAASMDARPEEGAARRVAIGSDHGGFSLKETLKRYLTEELGYTVEDQGTTSDAPCDYPDFAIKVARAVASGRVSRGIMIDGAGIGSAMAANKVPGVLAAVCHDMKTVVNSREHNNANVLTLGAGVVGRGLAIQMVRAWLATDFAGGRHERRVAKIRELEGTWTEKSSSRG
jgi:ribose 5-phosphate isomerase B